MLAYLRQAHVPRIHTEKSAELGFGTRTGQGCAFNYDKAKSSCGFCPSRLWCASSRVLASLSCLGPRGVTLHPCLPVASCRAEGMLTEQLRPSEAV